MSQLFGGGYGKLGRTNKPRKLQKSARNAKLESKYVAIARWCM